MYFVFKIFYLHIFKYKCFIHKYINVILILILVLVPVCWNSGSWFLVNFFKFLLFQIVYMMLIHELQTSHLYNNILIKLDFLRKTTIDS